MYLNKIDFNCLVKEDKDELENMFIYLYVSFLILVFCLLLNGFLVFYIICLR